jgi:hypothetical protein
MVDDTWDNSIALRRFHSPREQAARRFRCDLKNLKQLYEAALANGHEVQVAVRPARADYSSTSLDVLKKQASAPQKKVRARKISIKQLQGRSLARSGRDERRVAKRSQQTTSVGRFRLSGKPARTSLDE